MANGDGVMMAADVRAAQVLLDALEETTGCPLSHRLDARGVAAGLLADVRTAGYLEGVQHGRRQAGAIMRDALLGEGL